MNDLNTIFSSIQVVPPIAVLALIGLGIVLSSTGCYHDYSEHEVEVARLFELKKQLAAKEELMFSVQELIKTLPQYQTKKTVTLLEDMMKGDISKINVLKAQLNASGASGGSGGIPPIDPCILHTLSVITSAAIMYYIFK